MEHFYLEDITLKNYRKFADNTFRLNPQMNIFIGKNASGKTTVLEAVNVTLGAYLAAFKKYVPSRFGQNISESDILQKTMETSSPATPLAPTVLQFPCLIGCHMVWNEKNLTYRRIVEKEGGRTKFDGPNPMQAEVSKWEEAISRADGSDKGQVYPLVLYLSSARLWNENRTGEIEKAPRRMDAYKRCLDQKRGSQLAFDYIRLLQNLAVEENSGKPFPAYEVIMAAVRYSMKEELKEGQEAIYSSRYGEIAVKNPDGTVIPFASLSDGYRNVIKIVTEIAARMCILNPYLEKEILIETPGIVVIDEIDLSLHPTWQRRIIRILKELFPKVQFICATHSPFIIQALEQGELTALDGDIEEEYSGKSIEDIAEGVMDVSTALYSEKKEKMYEAAEAYLEALDREDITHEQLQELKERMDVLAAEYSDNVAYCALLKQQYLQKKIEKEG